MNVILSYLFQQDEKFIVIKMKNIFIVHIYNML